MLNNIAASIFVTRRKRANVALLEKIQYRTEDISQEKTRRLALLPLANDWPSFSYPLFIRV